MKFHVNHRGEPGVCRARKHCPFGDLAADHFDSAQEARAAYEDSMNASTFAGKTPVALTDTDVKAMGIEKQRLVLGAINRILTESNLDSPEHTYWQAAYDSTPAGQLELARKQSEKAEYETEHPEYTTRSANVRQFLKSLESSPMPLTLPEDPGPVLDTELPPSSPHVFEDRYAMTAQKTKLALISAAWISNLSPEEIEAVSWVTSNGSSVMNLYLSNVDTAWGKREYSEQFIRDQLKYFRSAMAKAPELDEPVIIYRGTGSDHAEIDFLDRPASASASGWTATGFRNGKGEQVLLEIKTKKVPAAVGMSAWGASELEVLAPLGKYKKVGEFTAERGKLRGPPRSQLKNDPYYRTLRVIQLEYLGD